MATLSTPPPRWAQRRRSANAEAQGGDAAAEIQTTPGGVPGRIQGVSPLQRDAAMKAYRARTTLVGPGQTADQLPTGRPARPARPYQNGQLKQDAGGNTWQYDATKRAGSMLKPTAPLVPQGYEGYVPPVVAAKGAVAATPSPAATIADVGAAQAKKRQQLILGGLQPSEADMAVKQEAPRPKPMKAPMSGAVNATAPASGIAPYKLPSALLPKKRNVATGVAPVTGFSSAVGRKALFARPTY